MVNSNGFLWYITTIQQLCSWIFGFKLDRERTFFFFLIAAIKTEPLGDSQLVSYGYPENQSLPCLSMKSLYQHLDPDSSCQVSNILTASYQRSTVDPRVQVFTPEVLDDQTVYYQSRGGSLVGSTMLYHAANQHYSNSGTTLFGCSPIALHPSSNFSQSVGTTVPMAKMVEAPHDPCSESRYEGFIQKGTSLGKSPPMRYIHHDQAKGRSGCDLDPSGQRMTQNSHYGEDERPSEKVTIKQESLRYAYLEDGEWPFYTEI